MSFDAKAAIAEVQAFNLVFHHHLRQIEKTQDIETLRMIESSIESMRDETRRTFKRVTAARMELK